MEIGKFLWQAFLIFLIGVATFCTILLFYHSYEGVTASIFDEYAQPEKLEKFRNTLLTRERFALLRICSALFSCLCLLFVAFCWNKYDQVVHLWKRSLTYFTSQARKGLNFWMNLSATEKYTTIAFFIVVFLIRLYFLFQVPFHIDERFTYLYFISKGLGVSIAYYPNPNNHILFTLVCNLAAVFLDDPWLVMKVPAFLLGLILLAVYWIVIRSFFDFPVTILATVLFSCSAAVWYYGLQGRGYSLLMIFVLVAIRSAFSLLHSQPTNLMIFFWFWLSCTLGLYTIPIFVYPFVGITAFIGIVLLFRKEFSTFYRLGISCVAILLATGILYAPVFIFNGWRAVSGNSWVVPLSWDIFLASYPEHLLSLAENMWGYFPSGGWILLVVLIYTIAKLASRPCSTGMKYWLTLFITCILTLIVLSVIQRILLFQRLIIYLAIFQHLIIAFIIVDILYFFIRKQIYRLYMVLLISIMYVAFNTYMFYKETSPEKFDLYDSFDNMASLLYQKNANHIFVNMYEYGLCIRFQYETNGKPIHIDSQQPVGGAEYQYLVLHKDYPVPGQISLPEFESIYADAEVSVYKKKGN